jgi:hypothetical protein
MGRKQKLREDKRREKAKAEAEAKAKAKEDEQAIIKRQNALKFREKTMIVHDDPQGSEYHDMYPKSECYVKVQQVLEEFKDQDLDDDE